MRASDRQAQAEEQQEQQGLQSQASGLYSLYSDRRRQQLMGRNAMGLAAIRSSRTPVENDKVAEVHADISKTVEVGGSNVVPFPSKEGAQ